MRYGIFADIHGNLEALTAVLAALKNEKVDEYHCCGDVVGYGANPSECISQIHKIKCICVAGNHDWAVAGKIVTDNFSSHARSAVEWTCTHINPCDKEFLESLDLVYRNNEFIVVHGTLDCPQEFDYLRSRDQAIRSFAVMNRRICFIGHSHVPGIFDEKEDGSLEVSKSYKIDIALGCRYIINVGSVGQPRDGNPEAAYGIFDSSVKTIEIKRVRYDIASAKKKILDAGLPSELGSRLASGR
ncbi:MAG: metallophosphoesterase family protein [Candidatus Omnitrophica bacterium]|nr:metallophosphoesterase family protein [Candidatus Omnitrophota bacterium]